MKRRKPQRAMRIRTAGLGVVAMSGLALSSVSVAGPSGEQVVAGQVAITREGAQTTIAASDNSVIRFDSFDIGAQEGVTFVQPDARSRVLNQIVGSDPTRMDGSLTANGQVFLVNPSGVIFGRSAIVNVGGLIAAAGALSSEDFLADRDIVTQLTGPVENHGEIEAGVIALFGQSVANTGMLRAPDGLVTMVAGGDVYIGRPGNNVVVKLEGNGASLRVVDPGIDNRGAIVADEVDLVVGDLHSFAMNAQGRIEASDISIVAMGEGRIAISGTLDASAPEPGAAGGHIAVRGHDIDLAGASFDASGSAGGGTVTLGEAGGASATDAARVFVDSASTLAVDAMQTGDGGQIIVSARESAVVDGHLSARGGALGGNGGFIEMSGRRLLDVTRTPDVAAPNGKPGAWLLNPRVTSVGSESDPITLGPTASERPVSLDDTLEWLECVMNRDCDPSRDAFDAPRLETDEQQKLRLMYGEAFGEDRQISGRRALREGVEAFRARPDAGDEVDGTELLRFLRANPEESSVALRYLGELSELVAQWKRAHAGAEDLDLGAACMLEIGLHIEELSAAETYEVVAGAPLEGHTRCP